MPEIRFDSLIFLPNSFFINIFYRHLRPVRFYSVRSQPPPKRSQPITSFNDFIQ
ncbi:MAG: hypothetical protein AAFQ63_00990 [Cyanobacteria bacterium J06621_11]